MIKGLIYDSNRMHRGTLENRLGNRGSVNLGSTTVMAILPENLVAKLGDQVLVSRLGNSWAVVSKTSGGGSTKEVKV
ncbi:hypothetical protein MBAV_002594 [Candidatus Magnetobacterium bavaricum]|uniref:Uncharacterized protein n=1 Tax=Candidatus Magnetobacterium bavaricum TaxID=29290 RepID=A0A0F3GWZ7_9BACT|nr:hypothetical protein MBAV_002594 [Candidatus Magnetobacterium bavaricum]